jgi:hypothetical protein
MLSGRGLRKFENTALSETDLACCYTIISCSPYFSTLEAEAVSSFAEGTVLSEKTS